jgi:hypothetical protein
VSQERQNCIFNSTLSDFWPGRKKTHIAHIAQTRGNPGKAGGKLNFRNFQSEEKKD